MEEIKGALEVSDWKNIGDSGFLHTPKLEIIDPDNKILAVCLAGGSEMGDISGIKTNLETSQPTEDDTEDESIVENSKELENISQPKDITPEDLGFVVGGSTESGLKVPKKKFSFSVNGSNNKAYGKLYDCSKSQNANIAVIERRNPGSIDGTFYSSPNNPICDSNLMRGSNNVFFYPGNYTLLNHTF